MLDSEMAQNTKGVIKGAHRRFHFTTFAIFIINTSTYSGIVIIIISRSYLDFPPMDQWLIRGNSGLLVTIHIFIIL